MSKIQTGEKSVDSAGYVQVTPAGRCTITSRSTVPLASGAKTPIGNRTLRKRSRMLIRNYSDQAGGTLDIGGDGVVQSASYPLAVGQSIELPVSPAVLVLMAGPVVGGSTARTLEIG